jgi:transposase-like protein
MEREWLERELAVGRSIESLAREVGRSPSTVAYWVNKHGLASTHATRHAGKGAVDREELLVLVDQGLTVNAIAKSLGIGGTSVRYWLRKHGLRPHRAQWLTDGDGRSPVEIRRCTRHGYTSFVRSGAAGRYRCKRCRTEHVSRRRRVIKQLLVAEAGGRCVLCGYDRFAGALQFHHRDPDAKAFALSDQGLTRSIERARAEVRKCVLLCATCHAEVEAGVATIPP